MPRAACWVEWGENRFLGPRTGASSAIRRVAIDFPTTGRPASVAGGKLRICDSNIVNQKTSADAGSRQPTGADAGVTIQAAPPAFVPADRYWLSVRKRPPGLATITNASDPAGGHPASALSQGPQAVA